MSPLKNVFNKHSLLQKILDIAASNYKEAFREQVVETTRTSLIEELNTLQQLIDANQSAIIRNFVNSDDINQMLGDGHFDKATSFKQLCHEMEAMVYDVLEQEFSALYFHKEFDLITGKIYITRAR